MSRTPDLRSCYLAVVLFAILSCVRTRPPAMDDAEAVVTRGRFTLAFPATPRGAVQWVRATRTLHPGYYNWRFGVSGSGAFSAAAIVNVDTPDAANAHGSLEAVITRSVLRRCAPPNHILVCATPLAGRSTVKDSRVIIDVQDSALVSLLQRERPRFVWRVIFLPDTILPVDSVRIRYADR